MATWLNPAQVLARINRDVERSALRARNGVRYVRGSRRPALGTTPKDVVWERDKAQLWRYHGPAVRYSPPVLIVHSLVSRSYILDLRPGNSAIEYLVNRGLEVFLLDWGVPDELDSDNGFERYVDEYIPRGVGAALKASGADELTMVGYCLGGLLAILYASGHDGAPVRNLIGLATPADFKELGPFTAMLEDGRLNAEHLFDETGNVPPETLYGGFVMVAPTKQAVQYATLLENLWDDEFVEGYQAMAQWTRDHVPFPGAAFRQMAEQLIREETLLSGGMELGGRKIEFSRCQADFLSALAECDNVVPPPAVEPWMNLVGDPGRREEMRLPGGHVTFATGRTAFAHSLPRLTDWIVAHSDELPFPKER